ncbi:Uncharacterised protein [Vibrio metschnikovii]|nr:Uncharacterised protein [Vibrio metschnikovii]SUP51279.1 Uncharacterised protein [Vibrio metschnikovii]
MGFCFVSSIFVCFVLCLSFAFVFGFLVIFYTACFPGFLFISSLLAVKWREKCCFDGFGVSFVGKLINKNLIYQRLLTEISVNFRIPPICLI